MILGDLDSLKFIKRSMIVSQKNHSLLGLREIADLVLLENLSAEDLAVFKFAITNHNAIEIDSNGSERQQLFIK